MPMYLVERHEDYIESITLAIFETHEKALNYARVAMFNTIPGEWKKIDTNTWKNLFMGIEIRAFEFGDEINN